MSILDAAFARFEPRYTNIKITFALPAAPPLQPALPTNADLVAFVADIHGTASKIANADM